MTITKNNILAWSVLLLIAANIALMIFIWTGRNKQRPPVGSPADYLVKELSLNDQQQKKLHDLARQHHTKADEIKEKIKDARHNLFVLLKGGNDSLKYAAADSVSTYLKQLDLLTFDHFRDVRAMLTTEQQQRFDDIIEDVLRMIAAPPPPGRGPGRP